MGVVFYVLGFGRSDVGFFRVKEEREVSVRFLV